MDGIGFISGVDRFIGESAVVDGALSFLSEFLDFFVKLSLFFLFDIFIFHLNLINGFIPKI